MRDARPTTLRHPRHLPGPGGGPHAGRAQALPRHGGPAAGPTLLHRLVQHYQEGTHTAAERSQVTAPGNHRCTEAIVSFVSHHFYVAGGSPIHASGKILHHPQH